LNPELVNAHTCKQVQWLGWPNK